MCLINDQHTKNLVEVVFAHLVQNREVRKKL